MATAAAVSLTEYLTGVYRPDCDYLDGELLERNAGEWDHSRLQTLISRYFGIREVQWGILVTVEQRLQVTATRYRVPDVMVLTGAPAGPIVDQPPLLCIELLSPTDRVTEMQTRIDDYLKFGVRYVWVIDPKSRRAFVYRAKGMTEVKDGELRTEDPDLHLPLFELK